MLGARANMHDIYRSKSEDQISQGLANTKVGLNTNPSLSGLDADTIQADACLSFNRVSNALTLALNVANSPAII